MASLVFDSALYNRLLMRLIPTVGYPLQSSHDHRAVCVERGSTVGTVFLGFITKFFVLSVSTTHHLLQHTCFPRNYLPLLPMLFSCCSKSVKGVVIEGHFLEHI